MQVLLGDEKCFACISESHCVSMCCGYFVVENCFSVLKVVREDCTFFFFFFYLNMFFACDADVLRIFTLRSINKSKFVVFSRACKYCKIHDSPKRIGG